MALTRTDLAPYVSITCAHSAEGAAPSVTRVLEAIETIVMDAPNTATRQVAHRFEPSGSPSDVQSVGFVYKEQRVPRWMRQRRISPRPEFVDITHHLVLVARSNARYAIYSSDGAVGRQISMRIGNIDGGAPALADLTLFDPDRLQGAFMGTTRQTKTLWMSGLHRRTAVKADSKVLSGTDLGAALNPLGDQSFRFTAARASVGLVDTNGVTQSTVIGLSPTKSRVWSGPSRTWHDFLSRVVQLLSAIDVATPNSAPLPVVAQLLSDSALAASPYDVSAIDPILLSEGNHDDDDARLQAEKWATQAVFETDSAAATTDFVTRVQLDDVLLGEIEIKLEPAPNDTCTLTATPVLIGGVSPPDDLVEAAEVLERPGWATIRFASGHTYQDGRLYAIRFRDQPFKGIDWLKFDPAGRKFSVKKEKPMVPGSTNKFAPDRIGAADDPSLFTWTHQHYLDPNGLGSAGWLLCDDGAGEIADFIHIDDTVSPKVLRLIHVKGANSGSQGRGVSASAYEVVVGQAVKNLRFLDSANLATQLGKANEELQAATWHNGVKQSDRSGVIAIADSLGTDVVTQVVILQPHITKPMHVAAVLQLGLDPIGAAGHRLRQFDALLLEAQAACNELGATLRVWLDEEPFVP